MRRLGQDIRSASSLSSLPVFASTRLEQCITSPWPLTSSPAPQRNAPPSGDFRNNYFSGDNLRESVKRAEALRQLLPPGMTMAEMAMRWILSNPDVILVIPGICKAAHVDANLGASDKGALDRELLARLRPHRCDRRPAAKSD